MHPIPRRPAHRSVPHQSCVAGHFGELVQGRLGPRGPVVLITLPCRALAVRAVWQPGGGPGLWQGARPVLSRAQLLALHGAVRGGAPGGRLRILAGMVPGGGAGASTAALLAAMRAMARAPMSPRAEAALCLALEGASDPLMHPAPERILWAPRVGRVLAPLPPLPAFEVLGGFAGPGRRTDPVDMRFADVSDLVSAWRRGPGRAELAALASESARRNHALRGGPDPAVLGRIGPGLGALGVVAAHTGTALGLLFAPGTVPGGAQAALRAAGLKRIVRFKVGGEG
ncbi:MAG: propanediol utilization protein [Rhodobacteraceae bacterium]|nr:propanediol utilization protein [Paracoccaceae bacterium]